MSRNGFDHRRDFDAHTVNFQKGPLFGDLYCFIQVIHLKQHISGDSLLGLGERPSVTVRPFSPEIILRSSASRWPALTFPCWLNRSRQASARLMNFSISSRERTLSQCVPRASNRYCDAGVWVLISAWNCDGPVCIGESYYQLEVRAREQVHGKRFGVAAPTVSLAQVGRGREIVSSTSTAVPIGWVSVR